MESNHRLEFTRFALYHLTMRAGYINARGNRTLVPCVKGKCINRYTMASYAKGGIEPPTSVHETDMLPLHYFAYCMQAERFELSFLLRHLFLRKTCIPIPACLLLGLKGLKYAYLLSFTLAIFEYKICVRGEYENIWTLTCILEDSVGTPPVNSGVKEQPYYVNKHNCYRIYIHQ